MDPQESLLLEEYGVNAGAVLSNLLSETGQRIAIEGLVEQAEAEAYLLAMAEGARRKGALANAYAERALANFGRDNRTAALLARAAEEQAQLLHWLERRIAEGLPDFKAASAELLHGRTMEYLGKTGGTALTVYDYTSKLAKGDTTEAIGVIVGTAVGGLAGVVAAGAGVPVFATAAFVGLVSFGVSKAFEYSFREDIETFQNAVIDWIETLSDGVVDVFNDRRLLDNGIELDIGVEELHQLLFFRLDPEVSAEAVARIEAAISREAERGVEPLLKALERLVTGDGQGGAVQDADAYSDRVIALLVAIQKVSSGTMRVEELSVQGGPAEWASKARYEAGYRYALRHLLPFAIVGDGAEALFAQHNQNGELDVYDDVTGEGTLSTVYLADRALYLSTLLARNSVGIANGTGISFLDFPEAGGGSDPETRLPAATALPRRFVFGGEGGDILMGGGAADHLYGGGGGDSLYGGKGDDRLEGNAGADRLYGGPGSDVLEGGAGDDILHGGHHPTAGPGSNVLRGGLGRDIYFARPGDVVTDRDGDGLVFFGGQVLLGGVATSPGARTYASADDRFHYALTGSVLTVTRAGLGQFTIEDFQPGRLGIVLSDEVPEDLSYTLHRGTAGDDRGATIFDLQDGVAGDDGANQLFGYGGDDDLHGRGGPDMLLGGRGDDYLDGGAGDDLLRGAAGRDVLRGNSGDDRLFGGTQADVLSGDGGGDVLAGGPGGDALFGGAGADVLHGGGGNDIVFGEGSAYATGRDWDIRVVLRPRAPDEKATAVRSQAFSSAVALGPPEVSNGDLVLHLPGAPHAAGGADHLYGGAGDDFLHGFDGDDVLVGGAGDDGLFGDSEDDVLVGGAGHDFMSGGEGADTLLGGAGHDALWGNDGDDRLAGGGGHDLLHGDHPTAPGQAGNDVLHGDWGDDDLHGGAGDDALHGGAGDDRLWGGPGTDVLYGGRGDDHYHFVPGGGQDLLRDTAGTDTVRFTGGLHLGQLQFGWADGALRIGYGAGDTLTIAGWADSSVDTIDVGGLVLGRREVANLAALESPAALLAGTPRADSVTGTAGDDVLVFQGGDDVYHGGAGDDRYLVAPGLAARVTVVDGEGADSLTFLGGGEAADLAITREGDALGLSHGPSHVTVAHWQERSIEAVHLGDGTTVRGAILDRYFHNRAPVAGAAPGAQGATVDTPFAFHLPQGAFVDADGDPLDYRLEISRAGEFFPEELDWLAFDAATGTLTGTPGEMDQGRFTVHLSAMDPYGGVSAPQSFALDVALAPERNPLYAEPPDTRARPLAPFRYDLPFAPTLFLTIAPGENPGGGYAPQGTWLETRIAFNDGVSDIALRDIPDGARLADLAINGIRVADEAGDGGSGVGYEGGGEGAGGEGAGTPPPIVPDWLHYDAGANALYGTPSADDAATFTVHLAVRNQEIALPEQSIDITVPGLDAVPVLAVPPEVPRATAGEVFYYALPAATFDSGDGSPLSYTARLADGAPLPGWLTFDAATRTFHGTPGAEAVGPLALEVVATDGDGDALSLDLAVTVAPGPASPPARRLTGGPQVDVLLGGAGDDALDGGAGADVLVGGPGDDYYTVDRPDDRLLEGPGGGVDTLALAHPNHGGAPLADHVERLEVSEAARQPLGPWGLWATLYLRPRAYGNALDNQLTGSALEDVLKGLEGDDVLVGSDGLDEMDGGPGADTYRFGAGLTGETEVRLGTGDRIELVGVSPDEVTVERGYFKRSDARLGDQRRTYWTTGIGRGFGLRAGGLVVGSQEELFTAAGADTSGFAGIDFDIDGDGNADAHWHAADIAARLTTPTTGDDTLYAFDDGTPLYGGTGNDRLHAGAGDDTLYGGAGDDTLVAGQGDDRLVGGPGDDVYLWDEEVALGMLSFSAGHDRIEDGTGDDTVRLGPHLRPDNLAFARAGDDLVIQGPRDDASLTVADWFRDDTRRVERFTTTAGDALIDTQVALLTQAMSQFVADSPGIDHWHQAVREHPQDTATLLAAHWDMA